ncbi:MAG TPA: hypothetical protein VGX46_06070 [Vicinamibacterales bacterium]|jgi:hypothetical protein|nr:hypothetical protein [Vicinamibacterales bacterium]
MTDEPFYSPDLRPAPPRVAKPGELLWTLVKGEKRVTCELRSYTDPPGWECQCFFQGELAEGRRFEGKEQALEEAERHRTRLQKEGWAEPPS